MDDQGINRFLWLLFIILLVPLTLLSSYTIAVASYNFNDGQSSVITYVQGKGESDANFTQREIEHLDDVKQVMDGINRFFALVTIITIFLAAYLSHHNMLGKGLFWGGIAGGAVAVLVSLIGLLNFNGLFNQFHVLFFTAGSWLFSPEDKLIQLFPLPFFIEMTKSILIITVLLNGAVSVIGWMMRRGE